jgi:hypothetical protein
VTTETPHNDSIWLAGLLEGEGTFITYKNQRGTGRPCARVQLGMCDRDVVERAAAIMGGTVRVRWKDPNKPNWNEQYVTAVAGERAEATMRRIRPFMGARRGEKIDSILALDLSHHPKGGRE